MPDLRAPAVMFALCAALLSGSPAAADEPFYKGKRLSLIINFAAGGPTDIEGRLLAKHLTKHIGGHPSVLVQNMDGAGGMIGAGYLGEVAPKDGTTLGYFTGSAWRYANNPERFRVDFRTYEFVAYQPGTSIAYMRTDVPPGIKDATDIIKARGVVAGGLGAENSKDLLLRLGLDMFGVGYKYVTSYRGSSAARLALQQNEINFYAESPPSYRAVVEPTLVRDGAAIGIWYDANPGAEIGHAPRQVEGLPILSFPDLYRKIKGEMPSGQLWDAYRTVLTVNGAMQRQIVFPPGVPGAAVAALRAAVLRLNGDKEHAEEAARTIGYVPEWVAGPDTNNEVRTAITISPDMVSFIADFLRRVFKLGRFPLRARTARRRQFTSSTRFFRSACSRAYGRALRPPDRAGSGDRSAGSACPPSPRPTDRRACGGRSRAPRRGCGCGKSRRYSRCGAAHAGRNRIPLWCRRGGRH
jgi:tripartite-type tricarboxylate transporter receptor subunit TctC